MKKSQHVAFVSLPHPPHVGPTLSIARVLVRRGYRVTYVASDQFASRIADIGAEFIQCSPIYDIDGSAPETVLSRYATRQMSEIEKFYEENRPRIIAYDALSYAGRILANRWKIPAVQTSPTFAHHRATFDLQPMPPKHRQWLRESRLYADEFMRGLGVLNPESLFHREDLNIYLFPKVLQPYGETFGDRCLFAGRCAGEQPYYGQWKKPETGGKPIALVSTSTLYSHTREYFKMCLDAFEGLGWYLILSVVDNAIAESLTPLPADVEAILGVSHARILAHASLQICSGGIVTEAEAVYHGVPLIIASYDQPELEWQADNFVNRGLGRHLRLQDMTVENLRACITDLATNQAVWDKVKEVQRIVRREPGAEEAANGIEECLMSR